MEALISVQSRGMPVDVAIDGPVQSDLRSGQGTCYTPVFWTARAVLCNCHEDKLGQTLIRAITLSQGQHQRFSDLPL